MIYQILMLGGQGATGQQSENSGLMNIGMMALLAVVFFFFMIRPQMKRAKEQKKFNEGLKEGDNVVTSSGIHGRIVRLEEGTVILEMHDKAKIKFDRAAIVPRAVAEEKK